MRRGWIVLGGVVVVLLGGAVVADRIAEHVADNRLADKLADYSPFTNSDRPHVSVHGFPFLTQAVQGKYSDIEVSASDLSLQSTSGVSVDVHLHGVHVSASDAINGQVSRLPIDRAEGSVTVPYGQLAGSRIRLDHDGDQLVVTGPIMLPGYGTVTARGTGQLQASGDELRVALRSVSIDGVPVPSGLLAEASKLLTPQLTLPTLPYHLVLTGATATDAGVTVTGTAHSVVLIADS